MQQEKAHLTDALNQHWVAIDASQKALEEEAIVCGAAVSALAAVRRQIPDLEEAGNLSLEKLRQELIQKALSFASKSIGKKLDFLSATVPTGMLGIFLKVDQRFASWLGKK